MALQLIASHVRAQAQVQVKPWFLIIVDTSGSMQQECTNGATNAPNCDNCAGCSGARNSCGLAHTRINDAKCALRNILNSTGDAEFALMQFKHPCRADCASQTGGDSSTCDADMLVTISPSNYSVLSWVDGACGACPDATSHNQEIYAYGNTPIGQSLVRAKEFFANSMPAWPSPTRNDAYAGCRPVAVIMLTDGMENCNGNGPNAATALRSTVVPTPSGNKTLVIKTYAVGFGLTPGDTNLEALAMAGGTDAPGTYRGFYAQNEDSLSSALNQIVIDSQLLERCDGYDNDCDVRIDEDNAKYCDRLGIRTQNPQVPSKTNPMMLVDQSVNDSRLSACSSGMCAAVPGVPGNLACAAPEWAQSSMCTPPNILCASPGERCNSQDEDCDGKLDEGAPAIAESNEVCGDNIDNDCDQSIDEDCMGCISQPEICNGLDEDCDTRIDENVTRSCGTDTGECTMGTQTCTGAGSWSACTGVGPVAESCNSKDDDCDGVVDGYTQPCGVSNVGLCRMGVSTCSMGSFGSCSGNVDPVAEVCDNLDNDCDGTTSDDGASDSRVNQACGNNRGQCTAGTTACVTGEIVCNGAVGGASELCDGLDNDCDGNVDEGVAATDPNVGDDCVVTMAGDVQHGMVAVMGECRVGRTVCSNGKLACPDYVGPTPELCDNLDQDCDGVLNNAVDLTDRRVGQACGTSVGECDPGRLVCIGGMLDCDDAPPGVEVCNILDDDCDGLVDEKLPAMVTPCDTTGHGGVGACALGQEACIAGGTVCAGEITPSPEICDGLDNDCNGTPDEGNPGGNHACGSNVGECSSGITNCIGGRLECIGEDPGSAELCDGLDNDCDGVIDEGNPEGGAPCDTDEQGAPIVGSCLTSLDPSNPALPLTQACGECRLGTTVCLDADIKCFGTVGPTDEVCDGLDNDCDSPCVLDNADPQNPVLRCPADPCDLPTDDANYIDCDGLFDEGVDDTDPNLGVPCSGGSGECREGVSGCVAGVVSCVGGQSAVTESCNDKDDDCDTLVDEGFDVGAGCGSDVGECDRGVIVCDLGGGTRCQGEGLPANERCDGLDNDCDGEVDDGNPEGGMPCGSAVGECQQGSLTCASGRLVCSGERTRSSEVCDCLDNDCDGTLDEQVSGTTPICSGEGRCTMCQCAQPCREAGEFGQACAAGKVPLTIDGECRCVEERCNPTACAAESLFEGDTLLCSPAQTKVGPCVCKENVCTPQCSGVVCSGGLVCDAFDGVCKQKSCLLAQFACDEGEFCDVVSGSCQVDLCQARGCAEDQACRDGECRGSCAAVECDSAQICEGGTCVADLCATVSCTGAQVCDPASGQCVQGGACLSQRCPDGHVCNAVSGECDPDPCLRTTCPDRQICKLGECTLRCPLPLLDCAGICINPQSSSTHCGASDDCSGANAGQRCATGQVCSQGQCGDACELGFVACEGGCIDPRSDPIHCGAYGDCQGARAGLTCTGSRCVDGECSSPVDAGTGSGSQDTKHRVSVAGGSGCTCDVPGGRSGGQLPWLNGFALFGLALWRARRRARRVAPRRALVGSRRRRPAIAPVAPVALGCLLGASSLSSGCEVDTFCFDCDPPVAGKGGSGGTGGGGGSSEAGTGGGGGPGDTDGGAAVGGDGGIEPGDGAMPDAGPDSDAAGACSVLEDCNGLDDDCDGRIDEGTDPLSEGIDLETDPLNCGMCGNRCRADHAFSRCSAGECAIESCDPDYVDFDQNTANGCEYRCHKSADDDTLCNQRDDDCDTSIDEDIDFASDLANCGSCGNSCTPANASDAGMCDDGTCRLDPARCNPGFVDVDGVFANGCEYQCVRAPDSIELCNGVDDDCDKKTDESVVDSDARLGVACGVDTGACSSGVTNCSVSGAIVCQGGLGPSTEMCNSVDDDCDGDTDESFPQLGLPCGTDVGECVRGNQQCMSGVLVCVGALGRAVELCDGKDNDCDGRSDETSATDGPPMNVGRACVTSSGGMLELDPAPPLGECRPGVSSCVSGALKCVGEVGVQPELCDDKDQDCDGDNVNDVSSTDPAIGSFCGIDLGECSFGTYVCVDQAKQCDMGREPVPEVCDGKDNDCDGHYDETDADGTVPVGAGEPCRVASDGTVHHGPGEMTIGECRLGTSVCSGGSVACPDYVRPSAELCDGKDQDCDGDIDNSVATTDPRIGQPCSGVLDIGTCDPGSTYCNAGAIACQGTIGPSAELCDGLDNDCDGSLADDGVDELTRGQSCGSATGACSPGTLQCASGAMQCAGQGLPSAELCDSTPGDPNNPAWDNDCDTRIDEDFQLATNVNRCGTCNTVCSFANATARCVSGVCGIASCVANYHDSPYVPGPDCSVGPCTIAGSEICNGSDDDCDGRTDEGLSAPAGVCKTLGACASGRATCDGVNGWVCDIVPVNELCNAVDDNCNGSNNEGFPVGAACSATGVGGCATRGTLRCNAMGTATFCADAMGNPVVPGTPGTVQETCNGVDDDCDTRVDESCPSADSNCVTDAWVSIGGGVDIYKYEASRPDATLTSAGSNTTRACSAASRLPWANVTYTEALNACEAADPNGRLCSESEWQTACREGTCVYAFPNSACVTYIADQCNGVDYVATPDVQASGKSGARDACYRGPMGTPAQQIFELTGNVKEYTLQRKSDGVPVRGGANNNTSGGLRCDFDFAVWPVASPFTNVGFRCCRSATPPPAYCDTFELTNLNITHMTTAQSSMEVSLLGPITDLNVVNFTGTHNTMSQVNRIELIGPDNTTVALTNTGYCGSSNNWSYAFDQQSSTLIGSMASASPCGSSGTYRPIESLASYNGKSARGTWTIKVYDNAASGDTSSPHINSWGLRICATSY